MYNSRSSLWPIAIEEHFYLLGPTTLIALLGRSFNMVRPLTVVSALAVAMWLYRSYTVCTSAHAGSGVAEATDRWRTFHHSTLQRPDGLFSGCATVIVLTMPRTRWIRWIILISQHLRFLVIPALLIIITRAGVAIIIGVAGLSHRFQENPT